MEASADLKHEDNVDVKHEGNGNNDKSANKQKDGHYDIDEELRLLMQTQVASQSSQENVSDTPEQPSEGVSTRNKRKLSPPVVSRKRKKRSRSKITLHQKYEVVKRYEGGQRKVTIGREMGLKEETVRSILRVADKVRASVKAVSAISTDRLHNVRSQSVAQMENMLVNWTRDLHSYDCHITMAATQKKALSLLKDIEGDATETKFLASRGWYFRFNKRHGFNKKTPSTIATDALKYSEELGDILEENDYNPKQIFTIDKCSMWTNFQCQIPNQNYTEVKKKLHDFTTTDDRSTLLLGSNIEGNCKLKPVFIYHQEKPFSPEEEANPDSLPVHYYYQKRNLLTATIFSLYFKDKLHSELKAYCEKEHIPFKILLILDHSFNDLITDVPATENIKVIVLPMNIRSPLRPTNKGLLSIFKSYFFSFSLSSTLKATSERYITVQDYWKYLSVRDAIALMRQSWDAIPAIYLNNMWKLLCPQFVLTCNDVHMTADFNNANKYSMSLANALGFNNIRQEDIEEIMESYHQELSNEELLELEADRMNETEPAPSVIFIKTPNQVIRRKVLREALDKISMGLDLLHENDPKVERSSEVKKYVMRKLSCYRKMLEEKKEK